MGRWIDATKEQKCSNFRNCGNVIGVADLIYRKQAGVYLCGQCGTVAEAEPRLVGELEQSVMDKLAKMPAQAADDPIAISCLVLARKIDAEDVPPRDMTNFTKDLRIGMMQLRDLFPETEADDPTQKARDARERRAREQYGM